MGTGRADEFRKDAVRIARTSFSAAIRARGRTISGLSSLFLGLG
jgi:hypothetical protein